MYFDISCVFRLSMDKKKDRSKASSKSATARKSASRLAPEEPQQVALIMGGEGEYGGIFAFFRVTHF